MPGLSRVLPAAATERAPAAVQGLAAGMAGVAPVPAALARLEAMAVEELCQARAQRGAVDDVDPVQACLGWDLDLAGAAFP